MHRGTGIGCSRLEGWDLERSLKRMIAIAGLEALPRRLVLLLVGVDVWEPRLPQHFHLRDHVRRAVPLRVLQEGTAAWRWRFDCLVARAPGFLRFAPLIPGYQSSAVGPVLLLENVFLDPIE